MAKALASTLVLTPRDVANNELSIDQVTILDEAAVFIVAHAMELTGFQADMVGFVHAIFPTPAPWLAWKAARAFLRSEIDKRGGNMEWATQCFRVAYKEIYGELPTASGVNGASARKGQSAVKIVNGLANTTAQLVERLRKAKGIVNGDRLAKIAKLVASLALELKAERKDLAA